MKSTRKSKNGYKIVKWMFGEEIEIPEEWEMKSIEKLFTFISTGTNSRKELGTGNYHYIHYVDIHTKWNLVLDCDLDEISRIEEDKVQNISPLKEGDLIIADASEDHEGFGASVVIKNIKNRKIVSGLHTIALRDKNDQTVPDFRTYLTSIHSVKIQIIAYVTGISVYGLSKKNLKQIIMPIPPSQEQQRIASILSGVDAIKYVQLRIKLTIVLILLLLHTNVYNEFNSAEKNLHHHNN